MYIVINYIVVVSSNVYKALMEGLVSSNSHVSIICVLQLVKYVSSAC